MKLTLGFFMLLLCVINSNLWSQTALKDRIQQSWEVMEEVSVDSALVLINEILLEANQAQDPSLEDIARAKSFKAVYLDIQGNSNQSLPLFLSAIVIQTELGADKDLAFSYNNLGLLYFFQDQFEEAEKYLKIALALFKKLNIEKQMMAAYTNLAYVKSYLNKPNESMAYADSAIFIAEKLNDPMGATAAMGIIGKQLREDGEFEQALEIYLKQFELLDTTDHVSYKITNAISLSYVYNDLEQFDSGYFYGNLALDLSVESGNKEREQYCYDVLQENASAKGDFEKAYSYLNKYHGLRDSLLTIEKTEAINGIQGKYNVAEKEIEILREKQEKELLTKEKQFLVVLSIGISVVVILLLLAYFSKRKLSRLLADKNKLAQEKIVQKQLLIGEIHHRVKNNLQLISSILFLKSKTLSNQEAIDALVNSRMKIQTMGQLHQFLYQKENLDDVNLKTYLSQAIHAICEAFKSENKDVFYNMEIQEDVVVDTDQAIVIAVIISELISNIYKHAFPSSDGEFTVKVSADHQHEIVMSVEDTGAGSDQPLSELIQRSFGLRMVRTLVDQWNGNWVIDGTAGMKHKIKLELNG